MAAAVNLLVPLKPLGVAKSRLAPARTAALVLAMAMDTVAAAVAAAGVDRVLVVAAEPAEVSDLARLGAEVIADGADGGLNASLQHGAATLRAADPHCVVGALQGDLPALLPAELTAAIAAAGGRRAFCADRAGHGTTLLLSAAGGQLDPRFGPHSALAHAASGAVPLTVAVPTLRSDVDTPGDLEHVRQLGVGEHTHAALLARRQAC